MAVGCGEASGCEAVDREVYVNGMKVSRKD